MGVASRPPDLAGMPCGLTRRATLQEFNISPTHAQSQPNCRAYSNFIKASQPNTGEVNAMIQEVVVGIDGLDWYQPSEPESNDWLMKAPPTSFPLWKGPMRAGHAYRQAPLVRAPLPTFLPVGKVSR